MIAPAPVASLTYWPGAGLVKVATGRVVVTGGGGARGTVGGDISAASRRRLMVELRKVRRDVPALFATVTYPASMAPEPNGERFALARLRRRFLADHPQAATTWRREWTARGVPHGHFLVWGVELEPFRQWLRQEWTRAATGHDVVAGLDHDGGRYRTNVEAVQGTNGAEWYVCKYLSKSEAHAPAIEAVEGRHWGIWGPLAMFQAEPVTLELPQRVAFQMMRSARKAAGVNRNVPTLSVYSPDPTEWARLARMFVKDYARELGMVALRRADVWVSPATGELVTLEAPRAPPLAMVA